MNSLWWFLLFSCIIYTKIYKRNNKPTGIEQEEEPYIVVVLDGYSVVTTMHLNLWPSNTQRYYGYSANDELDFVVALMSKLVAPISTLYKNRHLILVVLLLVQSIRVNDRMPDIIKYIWWCSFFPILSDSLLSSGMLGCYSFVIRFHLVNTFKYQYQ